MEITDHNCIIDESDSILPKEKWFGDQYVYQINGFWLISQFVPSINRVLNHFKPLPNDVILASFPKTGTTWLKSLVFSIINHSSKEALIKNHPHELVPTLEVQVYTSSHRSTYESNGRSCDTSPTHKEHACNLPRESSEPSQHKTEDISCTTPPNHMEMAPNPAPDSPDPYYDTTRIFSTHIPYQLISQTLNSSQCRVVYITRNPKDTLVSMWHFVNKWKMAEQEPWPIEVATEKFCTGVFPCGPYYDHVLGYRKASLERPDKVFFITYEELKNDPKTHVKNLAEFLGCPFEGDDKELELEEIIKNCSFDELRNYDANKSEEFPNWFQVPYNSFFRKGGVGDYQNYLNSEAIESIDALTKEKFHGSGFKYGI